MAIYSFGTSGAIDFSSRNYGDMKRIVARVIGAQGDPDAVGAGDAIAAAIDRLNEYDWDYLSVKGSDITVTAGTATYALPTPIKHPSSLRFDNRGLEYVRRADYDKLGSQQVSGTATHYTLFNSRLSGNFEIIPSPNTGGTCEIRYFRPVARPTADSDLLDIMQWMERYMIFEAQAQLVLQHGDELGRYDRLQALATEALRGCLANDRLPGPDADINFRAYDSWASRNYPVDHAYNYILETD